MQQKQPRPANIEKFHQFLRSIPEIMEKRLHRACLLVCSGPRSGQYTPPEIDKAIDNAKKNPAYQTAARTQLAETWKTLEEIGKAALLDMHFGSLPTGKPN